MPSTPQSTDMQLTRSRQMVREPSRRTVHGPDLCARVRRDRRRIEGRVLDRVAHPVHVVLTHGFDVEQRATVREPELPVVRIFHPAPKVHEVVRRTDVQLNVLQDRRHVGVAETKGALRAPGIHRARGHPLVDRDLLHLLARSARVDEGHPDAILQVAVQQPFATEHRELRARQPLELHDSIPFRRGDDRVDLGEVGGAQPPFGRGRVGCNLLGLGRAGNHARNNRAREKPGERKIQQ